MPIYLIIGREQHGDTLDSSSNVRVSEPVRAGSPEQAIREANMANYVTGEIYVLASETPAAHIENLDL